MSASCTNFLIASVAFYNPTAVKQTFPQHNMDHIILFRILYSLLIINNKNIHSIV
jgi:hypothetical protein